MIVQNSYSIDKLLRRKKFKSALNVIKKHYTQSDLLFSDDVPFIDTNEYRVYLIADFSEILAIELL